jgi:hypothetical protein
MSDKSLRKTAADRINREVFGATLTVRCQWEDLEFLQAHAAARGVAVADVVRLLVAGLRERVGDRRRSLLVDEGRGAGIGAEAAKPPAPPSLD